MRRTIATTLLTAGLLVGLAASGQSFAAVRGERTAYIDGTVTTIPQGAPGSLDASGPEGLVFSYEGGSYALPYANITSLEYGAKAGHHTGIARPVNWIPLLSKKKHLLTVGFKDADGHNGTVVFEIAESTFQPMIPGLEARTGQGVKRDRRSEESEAADQKKPSAKPQAVSVLMDVTFISDPAGAVVSFYGAAAGTTPLTTKLAPGNYTVTLSGKGFPAWSQEITVESGKPLTVKATLQPLAARK